LKRLSSRNPVRVVLNDVPSASFRVDNIHRQLGPRLPRGNFSRRKGRFWYLCSLPGPLIMYHLHRHTLYISALPLLKRFTRLGLVLERTVCTALRVAPWYYHTCFLCNICFCCCCCARPSTFIASTGIPSHSLANWTRARIYVHWVLQGIPITYNYKCTLGGWRRCWRFEDFR
jgi:hypothetical protein